MPAEFLSWSHVSTPKESEVTIAMPMTEWTTYQIVCDHDSCLEEASEASREELAERYAEEDGFVSNNGKWFCSKHRGEASSDKKARRR